MRGALFVGHISKDYPVNGATRMSELLESEHGIKARPVYGQGTDAIMDELRSLARDNPGIDEVTVIPLSVAADMFNPRPIDPDTIPKGPIPGYPEGLKLPEGKMPESKPVEIPEEVEVDGRVVRIRKGRPFGMEPGMKGVMEAVLDRYSAVPGGTAVVLVGHGSFDDSNVRAIEHCAGFVRDRGFDTFESYNEFREPTVEQAMDAALGGGFGDVLVIPIFTGPNFHTRVQVVEKLRLTDGQTERDVQVGDRSVRLRFADEVGIEPAMVDVMLGMING